MMKHFICIHGHFYQPPREDPWTGKIECQPSAAPFHDWNERITAECYEPVSTARVLDPHDHDKVIERRNLFRDISFNVGPTLLSWLEHVKPDVYHAIQKADREGSKKYGGHGPAIACAYNHLIMPLANSRDKETQIIWGIDDFVRHFGRRPEGMWLPETAVDRETLDLMVKHGIQFTILAPHQATTHVDTRVPHLVQLRGGRSIAVFFYDGPLSHAVSFEKLLDNGEHFLQRLLHPFHHDHHDPQLVHIATDGEVYGHHHKFGEMALAYVVRALEDRSDVRLTTYGEFLKLHPPHHTVDIRQNSSWSCPHGVERWRSDCGCQFGGEPGWNQQWRAPLREALDWLRDTVTPHWEKAMAKFVPDPWEARNRRDPNPRITNLLELSRQMMLMYTSCGWFFSDVTGIETIQILKHARRAIELAERYLGLSLHTELADRLKAAKSNRS